MPKITLPERTVVFHLENVYEKAGFPSYFNPSEPLNLYGQLKNGIKPSEWRDCKLYWLRRLCKDANEVQKVINNLAEKHERSGLRLQPTDFTAKLKVRKAWFLKVIHQGSCSLCLI